jgi:hypothetical protein
LRIAKEDKVNFDMIDIAKMPVQDHRKVINNADVPVKAAQQPLFDGPSTASRTVV